MSPRRKRVAVAMAFVLGAVVSSACRSPTQAELVITTSATCAELGDVAIVATADPASAESRVADGYYAAQTGQCNAPQIGSLVVTPSGDRAAVVVIAPPAGGQISDCKPPAYTGCIVARRAFSFIDHVSLTIPVSLDIECRDVPCDAFTTCRKGTCYSADLTCDQTGTCLGVGELSDGGLLPEAAVLVDGSPPHDGAPSDGSVTDGASSDGSVDGAADGSSDGGGDGGPPPDGGAGGVMCIKGLLVCSGVNCGPPNGCCLSTMIADAVPTCGGPTAGQCALKSTRYCCSQTDCNVYQDTVFCNMTVPPMAGTCTTNLP